MLLACDKLETKINCLQGIRLHSFRQTVPKEYCFESQAATAGATAAAAAATATKTAAATGPAAKTAAASSFLG